MAIMPKEGFVWNKAKKMIGRNAPCPCRSGKKFKKCHLDLIPKVIRAVKRTKADPGEAGGLSGDRVTHDQFVPGADLSAAPGDTAKG